METNGSNLHAMTPPILFSCFNQSRLSFAFGSIAGLVGAAVHHVHVIRVYLSKSIHVRFRALYTYIANFHKDL